MLENLGVTLRGILVYVDLIIVKENYMLSLILCATLWMVLAV